MAQVMVVDMLEGFARIGPLASPRVEALLPRQCEFLRALPHESAVVFLADAHEPDDFELRHFPPHCLRGTCEAEICPELLEAAHEARADVRILHKHTFSGFLGTRLERIILALPDPEWIVIGYATDCCIDTNVAELAYRGREVTVVRELVDTWDLSLEEARAAGLSAAYVHDAARINDEWFERRLPMIWGVRVVERWQDVLAEESSKFKVMSSK